MAKQNETWGAGYYMGDIDTLAEEEKRKREARQKKRDDREKPESERFAVVKQTMDLEFALKCLSCGYIHPRRQRVYAHVKKHHRLEKYDSWIYEMRFHCKKCSTFLTIQTDIETREKSGGFVCVDGCERLAGGYDELYEKNAEERQKAEDAKNNEDFEGEVDLQNQQDIEAQNRELEEHLDKERGRDMKELTAKMLATIASAVEKAEKDEAALLRDGGSDEATAEEVQRYEERRKAANESKAEAPKATTTATTAAITSAFAVDFSEFDFPEDEGPKMTATEEVPQPAKEAEKKPAVATEAALDKVAKPSAPKPTGLAAFAAMYGD